MVLHLGSFTSSFICLNDMSGDSNAPSKQITLTRLNKEDNRLRDVDSILVQSKGPDIS